MTIDARDTADLVAAVRADLRLSRGAFGAVTGRSAETIRLYECGHHRPPAIFFHDLIEAAPECGLRFNDIATVVGYRPIESADPARYASIHDFFLGVRVLNGRARAAFAAILSVAPWDVAAIEHQTKPHPDLVKRLARRFLQPEYRYADVVRRFRTLRPTASDLALRRQFRQLHETATNDARRGRLREGIIRDNVELARRLARREARRLTHPGDAAESWTIALTKAVDGHDPQYGDFVPYLRKWIFGEVRTEAACGGQSGTARILRDRVTRVCRARDELRQRLRREPTGTELAVHLGMPAPAVADVLAALDARFTQPLAHDVVASSATVEAGELSAAMHQRLARLDESHRIVVELRYLHDLDLAQIASRIGVDPRTAECLLDAALSELRAQTENDPSGPEPRARDGAPPA